MPPGVGRGYTARMSPLLSPSRDELAAAIAALNPGVDQAVVSLLVARPAKDVREVRARVELDPERGLVGDRWFSLKDRTPENQITLMRADVAGLLSPTPELFGDNLFAAIDTSAANLPPGTVVAVGSARCVVTAEPHMGCSKFARRAGQVALKLTLEKAFRQQQLRGVHLRVLDAGIVSVGDALVVLQRPAPVEAAPSSPEGDILR